MFSPSFTPRCEHSLLFRRMEGQAENFTPRRNFIHRGQNSPLRDNFTHGGQFAPRGKVKNGPQNSIMLTRMKPLSCESADVHKHVPFYRGAGPESEPEGRAFY
jgi:hypothetical protein